jgi:hypothetical protein
MSKVTLALGSFIVGACAMFFISLGNQASTLEQPSFAQVSALGTNGAPVVPPLIPQVKGLTIEGGSIPQMLDGLDCKECTFKDVTLTYAGGAYNFDHCNFSGTTRVVLSGAAANTMAILPLLQAITRGVPPKPPTPQKPTEQTATAKQLMTVSFASPFSPK